MFRRFCNLANSRCTFHSLFLSYPTNLSHQKILPALSPREEKPNHYHCATASFVISIAPWQIPHLYLYPHWSQISKHHPEMLLKYQIIQQQKPLWQPPTWEYMAKPLQWAMMLYSTWLHSLPLRPYLQALCLYSLQSSHTSFLSFLKCATSLHQGFSLCFLWQECSSAHTYPWLPHFLKGLLKYYLLSVPSLKFSSPTQSIFCLFSFCAPKSLLNVCFMRRSYLFC